jgi:hypothetical protein
MWLCVVNELIMSIVVNEIVYSYFDGMYLLVGDTVEVDLFIVGLNVGFDVVGWLP